MISQFTLRMFQFLIRGYQRCIAPALVSGCRFSPTCSHYALEALDKHGLWRGCGKTVWRLLRCQPLCSGGHDPV